MQEYDMNSKDIVLLACVLIWFLIGVGLAYGQKKLLNLYRLKIDATLPRNPSDRSTNPFKQSALANQQLRIIFKRYPDHPDIDQLAARARLSVLFIVSGMIAIIILAQFLY